jgi:O-antigen ligase
MRRLAFRIFCLAFAALPFELPVVEGLHGTARLFLGDAYILFSCGILLIIASAFFLLVSQETPGAARQMLAFYGLLFAFPGMLAIVTTAISRYGDPKLAVQQLALGYVGPLSCIFALFAMKPEEQRRAWVAFYVGWCTFLVISLVFLAISWQAAVTHSSFFAELTNGQKLFAWRYTFGESWNVYSVYIGNSNKESNYLLMFLLFSASLLGQKNSDSTPFARRVFCVFWMLAVFTLLILFSRAALLLLPLVVAFSGVWGTLHRAMKWGFVTVVCATAVWGYSALAPVLSYLFTATYVDDVSAGALGSFNDRFQQWSQIYEFLVAHKEALLFGLGSGGYGERFFGDLVRGTHNMFLDTLLESGLLGLVGLVVLIVFLFLHCFGFAKMKLEHRLTLAGLTVLLMLMFREHSLSYLYVTSMGGLCFTVMFYELCRKGTPLQGLASGTQKL